MTTRAIQIDILISGMRNQTTGAVVDSGTVYFYEAGTTNAKNVWTEKEKTNPYTSYSLNGIGAVQLYGEGNYKLVIKDSDGSTVQTLDNIRLEYPYYGIRTVTAASVTMLSQDDFILCNTTSNSITIDGLAAASWTRPLKIQRISGSNSIIFDPSGAETIDGSSTLTISSDAIVEIISDGSNLRTAGFRSSFTDADNDTKVQVEEGADDDTFRVDTGGTERLKLDTNMQVTVASYIEFVTEAMKLVKADTAGYMLLTGGIDSSDGGCIILYGSTDSPASTISFYAGGAEKATLNGTSFNIVQLSLAGTNVDATAPEINNACDVSARVEELTSTGAVTAGVQSTELNHATVPVAATIADSSNHQGLFIVKDTSASGTAAHTLTLTSGTFDGTNNVATLNAPGEALVVYFDSAGNGVILENIGSVALS